MENTKVEVKINNMEYTIVSNEPEEYVQRVALLVNKKIAEVKGQDSHLSTAMLAVMAAMNLADELLKSDMTVDNLRNEMSAYMDEAQRNGAELEGKKLEVETLKEDLHKLEIELAKRETELENLRGSLNTLQKQSNAYPRQGYSQNRMAETSKSAAPSDSGAGAYMKPSAGVRSYSGSSYSAASNDAQKTVTARDANNEQTSASSAASSRVKYAGSSAMDKYRKK